MSPTAASLIVLVVSAPLGFILGYAWRALKCSEEKHVPIRQLPVPGDGIVVHHETGPARARRTHTHSTKGAKHGY